VTTKKEILDQDLAKTYNQFKSFEGRRYTGMKVGGRHKWHYDKGEWKEVKVAPDRWEFTDAVPKRRAGHAPPGSGVPVGTEYHWYVLAHQNVTKLNANDYTTSLTGLKFKIAHKRAGSEKWSATPRTQRKRMIAFLEGVIADLKKYGTEDLSERPAKTASAGARTASPARPAVRRAQRGRPDRRTAAKGSGRSGAGRSRGGQL